jgi:hypothetical protein
MNTYIYTHIIVFVCVVYMYILNAEDQSNSVQYRESLVYKNKSLIFLKIGPIL